ncbi:MAG: hypothetical protein Q8P82_00050 [bacterium]|nr:hypothetical protein [bacterium]
MRNALLSVYDKRGIVEFAQALVSLDWYIISSGGTAAALREAGVPVTEVSEITGRKAVLGHRVVTLAPEIHGGLLATPDQRKELEALGFPWIDLVCVDLYPLKDEIARVGATRESVIEKTDIGGPTMLRSGAKGQRIVISDPEDREAVLDWLRAGEPGREIFIAQLAAAAEAVVADYCLASARYQSSGMLDGIVGVAANECKYGENGQQKPAALFSGETSDPLALSAFVLADGDALSYNNWCDVDRLVQTMTHIAAAYHKNLGRVPPIAVGVKHGNACGAAVSMSWNRVEALQMMLAGDPLAIFGGLVMTNFTIGADEANCLRTWKMPAEQKRLLDGVIAPEFGESAAAILGRKGGKCRLVTNPALAEVDLQSLDPAARMRMVRGGFLRQPNYTFVLDFTHAKLKQLGTRVAQDIPDLALAWAIGSTSNSNTITLVRNGALIGNAVGQQDRVGAAALALERARRSGHDPRGAVAYSDSFFPFPDGPELLAKSGIRAIFASSGSVKDKDVEAVCERHGVTLYSLPDSICRGFFGH